MMIAMTSLRPGRNDKTKDIRASEMFMLEIYRFPGFKAKACN